jgi:hypothetical protein
MKPRLEKRLPPSKRAALVALATSLGGRGLARHVERADDDPQRSASAWSVLTHGLLVRNAAVEVDWKEDAGSVLLALRRAASAPAGKVLAAAARDMANDVLSTEEVLERFGRALVPLGVALLQLQTKSDSYVLTLQPTTQVPVLRSLAKKGGGGARWFRGEAKLLSALEKQTKLAIARAEREAGIEESDDPWRRLVRSTWQKSVEGALWKLRLEPHRVDEVREALPFAPARAQPLVAMALRLHDRPASEVAREADDPALCAKALKYLGQERRHGLERLAAAAIVAERLGVPPKRGPLALAIVDACNLFGDTKTNDRHVKKLPPDARRRLARIAEDVLARSDLGDARDAALHALAAVGDHESSTALEASRAKIPRGFPVQHQMLDVVLRRIRARGT